MRAGMLARYWCPLSSRVCRNPPPRSSPLRKGDKRTNMRQLPEAYRVPNINATPSFPAASQPELRAYKMGGREWVQLFWRRVQRRLVFRFLVIFDQSESPTDQRREVLGHRFLRVQELLDPGFQLRLLIGGVEDFKDFHRQQPVIRVL